MKRLLIIDDDSDLLCMLSDVIKSGGYRAVTAENGQSAITQLKNQTPSLVLLDMKLPDKGGLEVLEEIKRIDKTLPVIMITGYGDIKDAVSSMKLGAFDYITKPFESDEILTTISKALKPGYIASKILSLRENEVLNWLKNGKSSWEISKILDITERTANFHVSNIISKLDAVNRTQAVAIAIKNGLID